MVTAAQLRESFATTRAPVDLLDVVMPPGAERWPDGMRERLSSTLKPAAVLIPLVERGVADLNLLLTQRSAELKTHAGQVSFPGGRMEPGDADIAGTALRETEEEVGIRQSGVSVIGFLDPMPTITGYAVTSVVGIVEADYQLDIDRTEVEYVFEVPLSFLMDSSNRRLVDREYLDSSFKMVEYHYKDERIWGATAFIIEKFIEIIRKQ
ncbi:MAG: CoA pyrophosphatase [Woeseiaceae bacterium]|nr:CoA pyrophosphatase [Woeseiaceae bacterium]